MSDRIVSSVRLFGRRTGELISLPTDVKNANKLEHYLDEQVKVYKDD